MKFEGLTSVSTTRHLEMGEKGDWLLLPRLSVASGALPSAKGACPPFSPPPYSRNMPAEMKAARGTVPFSVNGLQKKPTLVILAFPASIQLDFPGQTGGTAPNLSNPETRR
jgi:hypothetical protein